MGIKATRRNETDAEEREPRFSVSKNKVPRGRGSGWKEPVVLEGVMDRERERDGEGGREKERGGRVPTDVRAKVETLFSNREKGGENV